MTREQWRPAICALDTVSSQLARTKTKLDSAARGQPIDPRGDVATLISNLNDLYRSLPAPAAAE